MKKPSIFASILIWLATLGCNDEVEVRTTVQLYATPALAVEPYRLISDTAAGVDVSRQVQSMAWAELSAVKVVAGPTLFLEGSGSFEDGFSMIYGDGASEYITSDNPSYDLMLRCLRKFTEGDPTWRTDTHWDFYQQWSRE